MAGKNIKGLTVEIGGETMGLEAALKDLGKATNDINKELGDIERGLKFDPSNTVLLAQKHELLEQKIANTRTALDGMRQAQDRVEQMYRSGEIDEGQYRKFQRDVATAESKLETFEAQVKDVEQAQDKAAKSTSGWGDKLGSVAKTAGAAVAGLGTAFVAMGAQATQNAGEIQELADKTGLTAERIQELQYAGADLGVEMETIAGAQAKLTKNMDATSKGTGTAKDAFAKLGVKVTDANGNLRDSRTVMLEAFDALGQVGNETERDALAMQIFGRSAQELNPLISAGSSEIERLAQQARETGAVMSNESVSGLDAFGDGMDHLKTSIMATIGEAFAKIMPVVQPILDALLSAPGPVKVIIGLVAALAAGLAVLTPVIMAFTAVEWAALAPILPIVAAIAALIAIIVLCIKYHEEIKEALIAAWGAIKDFFTDAWNAIKETAEKVWNAIKDFFSDLWDAIKEIFWGAVNGIKDFVEGVWNGIKETADRIWTAIKDFFVEYWPILLAVFTGGIGLIVKLLVDNWDDITATLKNAWNAIVGFFEGIWQNIKDGFWAVVNGIKEAWNSVIAWFRQVPGWIKDIFVNAATWLYEKGKAILTGAWDGIRAGWEWVKTWFGNIGQKIRDFFVDAGKWLYDAGRAILQGLWDGIKSMASTVWDGIKGIGSSIKDGFKGVFGIDSPSKVFAEYGSFMMQGLADGLKSTIPLVKGAMSSAELAINATLPVGVGAGSAQANASPGSITYVTIAPGAFSFSGDVDRAAGMAAGEAVLDRLRAAGLVVMG